MNAPHKFIFTPNAPDVYAVKAICEYCGQLAYDANITQMEREKLLASFHGKPCPNSPQGQPVTVRDVDGHPLEDGRF
jgi:hypothetical protein